MVAEPPAGSSSSKGCWQCQGGSRRGPRKDYETNRPNNKSKQPSPGKPLARVDNGGPKNIASPRGDMPKNRVRLQCEDAPCRRSNRLLLKGYRSTFNLTPSCAARRAASAKVDPRDGTIDGMR
jgi:hypothetical protein